MPDVSCYLSEIDAARLVRLKELSGIKKFLAAAPPEDLSGIFSKGLIVLAYANWEGFYNDCVRVYIKFLKESGRKVCDVDWTLLFGSLGPHFNSLRDRHHSFEAKQKFVCDLKSCLDGSFEKFDGKSVEARSNLDFERLSQNYSVLNFDLATLQPHRIRLNKQVVKWRHAVAHGDPPDLSCLDASNHVDFVNRLLLIISDTFQEGIVSRSG